MPKPENVIPHKWNKGQSGNPAGRPKKLPELRELLAHVLGDEKDGKTAAEAILMALRAKATKGDVRAAELLLDRAYGKPKQDIELEGSINTVIMPQPVNRKATEPEA
jgi:hypothetical protein